MQGRIGGDPVLRVTPEPPRTATPEPRRALYSSGPASCRPASSGPASSGPASSGPASSGPASSGPAIRPGRPAPGSVRPERLVLWRRIFPWLRRARVIHAASLNLGYFHVKSFDLKILSRSVNTRSGRVRLTIDCIPARPKVLRAGIHAAVAQAQFRAGVYARLSETYDAAESVPTQLERGSGHAARRGWAVRATLQGRRLLRVQGNHPGRVRLSAYTGGDLDLSTAEGAYYGGMETLRARRESAATRVLERGESVGGSRGTGPRGTSGRSPPNSGGRPRSSAR